MQYVKLGRTGLEVSRLCFGCMGIGDPMQGNHGWSLPEYESRTLIREALDAGINFFDTANLYSGGTSEEFLGRALQEFGVRDELVIATKLYYRTRPGPNGQGLSRKVIMYEINESLRRLDTDYVDIYQIHRWDDATPIEETLEALHDVVKAGKARYLGASTMSAWQFGKAQYIARANGWTQFISMQDHYNLLYREEEREMHPLCLDLGVGVIPWSPLARGRLARLPNELTARASNDPQLSLYGHDKAEEQIVDGVGDVAERRGVPRAQVALAWLLSKPAITAPILGVTKPRHISDAIPALELTLEPHEVDLLEAPYLPHPVSGF